MQNLDVKNAVSAKNRNNDIDKVFGFGIFLLFALIVGAFLIFRVLLLLTMESSANTVSCFLNAKDITLMIGSELYAERMMTTLSYNFISDNLMPLIVGWLYVFLVIDYATWLISKFILIPKGIIKNPVNLKKPILVDIKSMVRYAIISAILIATAYFITLGSNYVLDVYQSRHTLIREHVLPDFNGSDLTQKQKEQLNQCAFNTDITVITGKSYVNKSGQE